LIPCLILPTEEEKPIGVFGQRHLRYLREYRKVTYSTLLTSGRLNTYLAEIDSCAMEIVEKEIIFA
ncbi:MAG: TnpV protein, partial [Lachnospiraceae bacterium]|nr:TnpV protein [Lachnospiraceae bacterium]